jgi:hypothetical protein
MNGVTGRRSGSGDTTGGRILAGGGLSAKEFLRGGKGSPAAGHAEGPAPGSGARRECHR